MSKSEFARMLAENRFFAPLEKGTIQEIAKLSSLRRLHDGQVLFQKGDPADALYGVRQGAVQISASSSAGSKLVLNVLRKGEVFGEVALLDGETRTADASASGRTELYVVLRPEFLRLLKRTPALALQVIELLCGRLRWMSERVEQTSLMPLGSRLARRLEALAQVSGKSLTVSQLELAQFLGVSREAVNRKLQEWSRAGWLKLGRGRIVLLDLKSIGRQ